MKILLIRPYNNEIYRTLGPDLGLMYLATALKKNNFQVEILDCLQKKFNKNKLSGFIKKNKFDVYGIKTFSKDLYYVKQISAIIKKFQSKSLVVAGGPHPSGDGEHTLNYLKDVDFAFCGEAEKYFTEFLKKYFNDESYNEIPGLVYRNYNGTKKIICNTPYFEKNINIFDYPCWDLMPPSNYALDYRGLVYVPIITTRGCPYNCTYCGAHLLAGKILRRRNIENIIYELKMLKQKFNINAFSIVDDNFTLKNDFAKKICIELIKNNINLKWNLPNGVRLDSLDKELLQLLEKSGCFGIDVAIESGSQKILNKMQRKVKIKIIKEKISLIKKTTKMQLMGYFIMGYPEETKKDIEKTISLATELSLDRAGFFLFCPHPGTAIYKELKNKNLLQKINWKTFSYNKITATYGNLSLKELQKLYRKAFFKFYFRLRIIKNFLYNTKSPYQFLKTILRALQVWTMK